MATQWLGVTSYAGYREIALLMSKRDCGSGRGDATGVDYAVGPRGQALADGEQRILPCYDPPKARLVAQLLTYLGCRNVRVESDSGLIPQTNVVTF